MVVFHRYVSLPESILPKFGTCFQTMNCISVTPPAERELDRRNRNCQDSSWNQRTEPYRNAETDISDTVGNHLPLLPPGHKQTTNGNSAKAGDWANRFTSVSRRCKSPSRDLGRLESEQKLWPRTDSKMFQNEKLTQPTYFSSVVLSISHHYYFKTRRVTAISANLIPMLLWSQQPTSKLPRWPRNSSSWGHIFTLGNLVVPSVSSASHPFGVPSSNLPETLADRGWKISFNWQMVIDSILIYQRINSRIHPPEKFGPTWG